jgi:hypothetical protein
MVKGISTYAFKVRLANLGYSRTDPKHMKVFRGAYPSFGHNFKNYVFAYIRVWRYWKGGLSMIVR